MISQHQLAEGSAIAHLASDLRFEGPASGTALSSAIDLIYRQAILIKQLQIEVAALQQKS